MKTFGQTLKRILLAKAMNQKELAKKSELTEAQVSFVVSGGHYGPVTVRKVIASFDEFEQRELVLAYLNDCMTEIGVSSSLIESPGEVPPKWQPMMKEVASMCEDPDFERMVRYIMDGKRARMIAGG